MNNVVLIGMPGAGKSTAGVLLAKTLLRPFVDTDLLIQTHENRSLQQIIDLGGMKRFLDIEMRAVCATTVENHVIATGGSVVYREETMAHLRAHGVIVYLALPFAEIARRIHNIATRGIARSAGQTLRDLYDERQALYARYADITLDAEGLTLEETVTRITENLQVHSREYPLSQG